MLTVLTVAALSMGSPSLASGGPRTGEGSEAALVELATRWARAVTSETPEVETLVSEGSAAYYAGLADAALHASAARLDTLHPVDQLQVLFLRASLDVSELRTRSGRQILRHAIEQGWIGQDLRVSDDLREVVVDGDRARGRLYKFGRDDRPDRGLQYFVREQDRWRVDIRGERERLRADFASFVARAGLADAEAAFFILEARLGRKVTPRDFSPLVGGSDESAAPAGVAATDLRPKLLLRVVAIRDCLEDPSLSAATIEDRVESIRYVVEAGRPFGENGELQLMSIDGDDVNVQGGDAPRVLSLDVNGLPLGQGRLAAPEHDDGTLLDVARLGDTREGLMSQWRNVGLRGRPQLLQQAWLVPEPATSGGRFAGLRARRVLPGSFWHQLGLAEGDLLERLNGAAVDSMEQWNHVLRAAQVDQAISIAVDRAGRKLTFRTRTIPTGSSRGRS